MPDVTMPNGDVVAFPNDMPKKQIRGMIASKFPEVAPKPEQSFMQKITPDKNTASALWEGVKAGAVPFSDEIQAGIAAYSSAPFVEGLTLADAYKQAKYGVQGGETPGFLQQQQIAQEQNPAAYYTGMGTGILTTGLAAAKDGGSVAPLLAQLARQYPKTAAAGLGGISGTVYGAGEAEGTPSQIAKQAGMAGGAGMLAGPIGAMAAQRVAGPLARKAMGLFRKAPAPQVQAGQPLNQMLAQIEDTVPAEALTFQNAMSNDKAMRKVIASVKKDFPDNFEQVLQAWKDSDVPLAKLYGNQTTSLAKGAAQYPGGKAATDTYFSKEVLESPERFKQAISQNISGIDTYYATVDDVLASGRAKAAPKYQAVEQAIVPIPQGGVKPEIAAAIQQARKAYPSELQGFPDNSVKVLDLAKRVLDDEITAAQRSGQGNFARSRVALRNEMVDHMDASVPGYKEARAVAGDYLSTTKAMDEGKNFMTIDPEILDKSLSKMSAPEKEAFKIGVGKQLRDQIEKKMEGANPYNSVFGSATQKKRLMKILSPTEYRNLEVSLRAEDKLFKMRNEVLGGSPTTSKAVAAAGLADAGGEALQALATGNIKSFGLGTIKTTIQKAFDGMNDKTATQVAKILYETDPSKKLQIIQSISGNKALTQAEKQMVKAAYFKANDFINPRTAGAIAAGEGGAQLMKPELRVTVTPRDKK